MQIGLNDLDPRVAEAFSEYVRARLVAAGKTEAEEDTRVRELLKKRQGRAGSSWLPFAFPAAGFALTMGGIPFVETAPALAISMWVASFASSVGATFFLSRSVDPIPAMREAVHLDELRAVFPRLTLSRAERVYCDALLLLADEEEGPSPPADATGSATEEDEARSILRDLNTLLKSSRQLDAQRERLLTATAGANALEALEEERAALERQASDAEAEAADDPALRADLQTSLALCRSRLEDARALERGLKRIDAQQQIVLQTLASVQSSVARRRLAAAPLSAPDLETIQQSVRAIGDQTRAVEQAVQEVMTLR